MFKKILIANRGEIAVRVIRACREMGIKTVSIYSEIDQKCLHVRLADEAYCIGKARSSESYLKYNEIVDKAIECGAEAIHPGYGFLSENADFAQLCQERGVVFIGPSPETIRKMGDKAAARKTMSKAGIPILKGTTDPVGDNDNYIKLAKEIGYPLLIKPAAGGGGKGMRIVNSQEELVSSLQAARGEAGASFGSDEIYFEHYINNARHIEFQILADNYGNTIHLGERECSIQRRHQKMLEESPSPALDSRLRKKMGATAVRAAKAVNYSGAGTIEFLLTEEGKYYFIEMNTRIQVEHPVTEFVTGVDLVKQQIKIAAGLRLNLKQRQIKIKGHAIECRINAEDPENNFMPSPGKVQGLCLPGGPGVRIDTHIYSGYEIPYFYDSLLAKIIVHANTRNEAIEKIKEALKEFSVNNIKTTAGFLARIVENERFITGRYNTHFVEHLKTDDNHKVLHSLMHKIMGSFYQGPYEDE